MSSATYTPGHSQSAIRFMASRSLQSHGDFFCAHLAPGLSVIDCGCGPGSITVGIANRISPGRVVGVDFEASQIAEASSRANDFGLQNVTFRTADCHELPFKDHSFDRVFCHALLEHLSDPVHALREIRRVLKPHGVAGVCSPDWNGLLVAPQTPALSSALQAYASLQSRNGGNLSVGHQLGENLMAAGFATVEMSARYECYPSLEFIGEYLALQLEREGDTESARTLRTWSQSQGGLFAQAWVSAVASECE